MNDLGDGAVEIYICQDKANRLCGRIVWLEGAAERAGRAEARPLQPQGSHAEPSDLRAARSRQPRARSDGGFDSGWIYDPKAGKSYSAAIRLAQRDQLVVTGYLGMKFMGKSFTWTRAPGDLPRCDGTPPAQPIDRWRGQAGNAAGQRWPHPRPRRKPRSLPRHATSTAKAATTSKTTSNDNHGTSRQRRPRKPQRPKPRQPKQRRQRRRTTAAVPKPKPAQKPANAVANANSGSVPPPQQPVPKSSAPKTIEADSATSWSN